MKQPGDYPEVIRKNLKKVLGMGTNLQNIRLANMFLFFYLSSFNDVLHIFTDLIVISSGQSDRH